MEEKSEETFEGIVREISKKRACVQLGGKCGVRKCCGNLPCRLGHCMPFRKFEESEEKDIEEESEDTFEDIVSEISKRRRCVRRRGKCGYRRKCCFGLYCGRVGRVRRCKKMIGK